MIDAYDVLGVSLDARPEDIKKAYHKMSLQYHPDKQVSGDTKDATERFNAIKNASEILQDAERRKVYDTFGVDLGEDRPEMEVWNIGVSTLLSPTGGFVLKTIIARLLLWLIDWRWIGRIFMLLGIVGCCLYWRDVTIGGVRARDPEAIGLFLNLAVVDVVIVLNWLWPLFADAISVFYLGSEVVGMAMLMDSWKVGVGAGLVSLLLAWLFRGWWWWILGLEVLVAIVLLAALTISSGIMRLWIDSVQTQHGEKLREWRLRMRSERKQLEDQIADLKRKGEDKSSKAKNQK